MQKKMDDSNVQGLISDLVTKVVTEQCGSSFKPGGPGGSKPQVKITIGSGGVQIGGKKMDKGGANL